jgi:hypothetical protein
MSLESQIRKVAQISQARAVVLIFDPISDGESEDWTIMLWGEGFVRLYRATDGVLIAEGDTISDLKQALACECDIMSELYGWPEALSDNTRPAATPGPGESGGGPPPCPSGDDPGPGGRAKR